MNTVKASSLENDPLQVDSKIMWDLLLQLDLYNLWGLMGFILELLILVNPSQ